MNHSLGKNVSYCLFKKLQPPKIFEHLHSLPLRTLLYTSCAVNSGHKLDTAEYEPSTSDEFQTRGAEPRPVVHRHKSPGTGTAIVKTVRPKCIQGGEYPTFVVAKKTCANCFLGFQRVESQTARSPATSNLFPASDPEVC
jgi:hypothetical protein